MKKLFIIAISLLFTAGFVAMSWAHGPNGGGGFRNHGYSQPSFSKPSFSRFGTGGQHGHSRYGSHSHFGKRSWGHSQVFPHPRRLTGIHQNQSFTGPLEKAYSQGIGVSPLRKALERKARPPVRQHFRTFQNRSFIGSRSFTGPLEKFYGQGVGVSPLRKSLERKAKPPVRHYSEPSHPFISSTPDPWFYYGNGDQLRQMGAAPPLPQSTR